METHFTVGFLLLVLDVTFRAEEGAPRDGCGIPPFYSDVEFNRS